ncbi:MAG: hypothetical protein J1F60_02775 [Oscillospiraceae bacterium]|nr:hypothetical protein [Oscillospiraceae bacterium]
MVGECAVITVLLLFAAFALIRYKRRKWAIATLPLTVVPFVNVMAYMICKELLGIDYTFFASLVVIMTAMVVSCTWIGFLTATLLQKRKLRTAYFMGCIAFNILLAVILLLDHYAELPLV